MGIADSASKRSSVGRLGALLSVAMLVAASQPVAAYDRPGENELVSRSRRTNGEPAGNSNDSVVSADGRFVVFTSAAPDLVPGDENQAVDVFVFDRRKNKVERVSVSSTGVEAAGVKPPCITGTSVDPDLMRVSFSPTITPGGRYVAFFSWAPNLVTGDTNGGLDVFVHDRLTSKTERVSLASGGKQSDGYQSVACRTFGAGPSLTPDGRYVAFASESRDLVRHDENDESDVFVYDRTKGTIERVSVASDGSEAEASNPIGEPVGSNCASIDRSGRFVVFTSEATNLVDLGPQYPFGVTHVYLRDRRSDKTQLLDRAPDGSIDPVQSSYSCTAASRGSALSADGRFVAFASQSPDLVPNDRNLARDVFVLDRKDSRIRRVTVNSFGRESGAGSADLGGISATGGSVTFVGHSGASFDPRMDEVDACCRMDSYIHEIASGITELVSVSKDGRVGECQAGNSWSGNPTTDALGRYVAYDTCNLDVVKGTRNSGTRWLIVVRARGAERGVGAVAGTRPASAREIHLRDDPADSKGPDSSEILEGSIVPRPSLRDLYVRLDIRRLPKVAAGVVPSPIVYSVRFNWGGTRYEVRAGIHDVTAAPSVGLFRCRRSNVCEPMTKLQAGFGTIGDSIVASVPVTLLAAGKAGVVAPEFRAGWGTYSTGILGLLDRL